ncbi:MAG: glycosyltransferase family 4 protein [Vicinamibacterales bacterium]
MPGLGHTSTQRRVAFLDGFFDMPSSISVPTVFASMARGLSQAFDVLRLPDDVRARQAGARRAVVSRTLAQSDVAILPGIVSARYILETLFARPRPSYPIVYLPVGELPRGAFNLRNALPYLRTHDSVLVNCEADARIVANLAGRDGPGVGLAPFEVDTTVFAPLPPARRRAMRAQLGLTPRDVLFLYTGRVCAEKNVHGALAAFQALAVSHPHVHFLVLGPNRDHPFPEFGTGPHDMRRVLRRQLASTPAVADRVHFRSVPRGVGSRGVAEWCGAADVFVNLTLQHDECFGLSAVEAMGTALPVIGSAWGGQSDTIAHGTTGFLVDTWVTGSGIRFDQAQATAAMTRLARSSALRLRLGEAARERALGLYAPAPVAARLCSVIDDALTRASGRRARTRLTAFGRRFDAAFRGPTPPGYPRPDVVSSLACIPRYETADDYALYRTLIAPYANRSAVPRRRSSDDVLFLRSPFVSLTRTAVRVADPLWPTTRSIDRELTRPVLAALTRRPFTRMADLRRDIGRGGLGAEVDALLDEGLIGLSPANA